MKDLSHKVLSMGLFILLFLIVWLALIDTSQVSMVQDKERVQQAIQKSLIECYSCEGFYPENIEYLKEHYGLIVNEEHYFISYDYEGENIMPQIYVYRKGQEG